VVNEPESYAGGSVATVRASLAKQVKGDDPDKKGHPGPPGCGLGCEADNLTSLKSLMVEGPNDGRRMGDIGTRNREDWASVIKETPEFSEGRKAKE
jgi:hypothetical protein